MDRLYAARFSPPLTARELKSINNGGGAPRRRPAMSDDNGPPFLTFGEWVFCAVMLIVVYIGGSALIAASIH